MENYDFFNIFKGKIVVSGDEKLIKTDPKIWEVLQERYQLEPEESVFVDDNPKNIEVAEQMGFVTVHITEETNLENELRRLGLQF